VLTVEKKKLILGVSKIHYSVTKSLSLNLHSVSDQFSRQTHIIFSEQLPDHHGCLFPSWFPTKLHVRLIFLCVPARRKTLKRKRNNVVIPGGRWMDISQYDSRAAWSKRYGWSNLFMRTLSCLRHVNLVLWRKLQPLRNVTPIYGTVPSRYPHLTTYDSRPESKFSINLFGYSVTNRPNYYRYSTTFPYSSDYIYGIYEITGRFFYSLFIEIRVLCHNPSYDNLAIIFIHNSWPPRFCFNAGHIWYSLGDEFPWYHHNQRRFFSYDSIHYVSLLSNRSYRLRKQEN
jgi:hypothetical protein